jgi:hypothetical protein
MSYKPEYYDRDRVAGIQLAKSLAASKTAAVIEDKAKNFKDIFDTAVAELGVDKLGAALLQAPPAWAHAALLSVPDWGANQQGLVARAGEASDGTVSPAAGSKRVMAAGAPRNLAAAAALMGGPLSKMTLNNHMAANCQWTIEWFDGKDQPADKYSDWNKWKWSGTLTAGCGSTMSVIDVRNKVPLSPLNNGDVIWVYVWVEAGTDKNGKDNLPSFQFTYDSGSPQQGIFGISGTTTINTLSVEKYPG